MEFKELREKYPKVIYEKYEIEDTEEDLVIKFYFEIPDLATFTPTLSISKKDIVTEYDKDFLNYLIFNIGMVELISYFKTTCSPNIEIKAGYLNKDQIAWFKKLYYNGLGEFRYLNNIDVSEEDFVNIHCSHEKEKLAEIDYQGKGNLIAVGGGKDSAVTLAILDGFDNKCFMINPKEPSIECAKIAGHEDFMAIRRTIDKRLIELIKEGYLNGHTPFSALVAFVSYLCAYLAGKKYIVLSNEASANEPTVIGTNINHQYSKTYEFECDFNDYVTKYFKLDIKYFSLLRPLTELQITMLFSRYYKYHKVFRSCNVGSKKVPWEWCCNCPKCLFVYIMLYPFLTDKELINIFGEDLYKREDLLPTMLELAGYAETKPFECVGTYEEVRYAISTVIDGVDHLPYLLQYYKDHYDLDLDDHFRYDFNTEHNVPESFEWLVRQELDRVNELLNHGV